MVHARAFGAPVPEVFDVSGPDIVMARASGPTMLDTLTRRPWTVRALARLLARLHAVVHQVPPLSELPAPFGRGEAEGHVLVHRDLHPQNVILTSTGPMIIDWEGAARGPAMYDVAMTWVIVGYSQAPGPRIQAVAMRPLQGLFSGAFVRAAGPIDLTWRSTAVCHRLADPNVLPVERARLERLPHG